MKLMFMIGKYESLNGVLVWGGKKSEQQKENEKNLFPEGIARLTLKSINYLIKPVEVGIAEHRQQQATDAAVKNENWLRLRDGR